jgi:hypothetical protein
MVEGMVEGMSATDRADAPEDPDRSKATQPAPVRDPTKTEHPVGEKQAAENREDESPA